MAPPAQQSPGMELHGPEVPRPRPLRIVKRGQTIAGCRAPGAVVDGGRRLSASSNTSARSPPAGVDRPLMVPKKRRNRGSVLHASLEDSPLEPNPRSAILELIERNAGELVLSAFVFSTTD